MRSNTNAAAAAMPQIFARVPILVRAARTSPLSRASSSGTTLGSVGAELAAMREMGSLMFVTGRFDVAERFYRRAVARDPTDRLAQGYLGCTLLRLGRQAEARDPLLRAGNGPWTACR